MKEHNLSQKKDEISDFLAPPSGSNGDAVDFNILSFPSSPQISTGNFQVTSSQGLNIVRESNSTAFASSLQAYVDLPADIDATSDGRQPHDPVTDCHLLPVDLCDLANACSRSSSSDDIDGRPTK